MTAPSNEYRLQTSHGTIAVEETGEGETPVLFIHGNSSCRKVFSHQTTGALARDHRLIALDLPGHGESEDAPDPDRSYSLPGLADAVIEVLRTLGIGDVIVFGWSLGGHIALEMSASFAGMRALMISGTPPIGRDEMALGFRRSGHAALGAQRDLSESEVLDFARGMAGEPVVPFLREAVARTDGRMRETLFQARAAGAGVDQRQVVESNPMPLAIVNGEDDAFIQLDFLDGIAYANLWDGRCHRLPGLGHAAFWSGPGAFNPIFERFVREVGASS